jgi:hypothetical protein
MKAEKQQTALEWLYDEFTKINHLTEDEFYMKFQQAKEMEREQIIEAQIEIVKSIVNQGNNNPYGILKKTLIELHKQYNEIRARNL